MSNSNSPSKADKPIGHYPLVRYASKMQLPFANILLVSARNVKKRPKKCESSKVVATPIHKKEMNSNSIQTDSFGDDSSHIRKLSKLRISILNKRKKKEIESFNSSLRSIYDQQLTKSKSNILKKDFEFAFKKMIAKKQISSKDKQLRASQELWNSMKIKKEQEICGLMIGDASHLKSTMHARYNSEKRLLNQTSTSFYNQTNSFASKLSNFYVTGQSFSKHKAVFSRQKDRQMPDFHLRSCLPFKHEGQIKPWNNQSRRYKTQTNQGKSGEITQWMRAGKHG